MGAGDRAGCRRAGLAGLIVIWAYMTSTALAMVLLPETVASWVNRQPDAIAAAAPLLMIAALFQLSLNGSANPGFGSELLLPAYAAAFLGVTTYRPGYYNVPGTIVAIVLLAVGFNGLNLLGAAFWVQPIFNGAVLLLAVITARSEARHVKVG